MFDRDPQAAEERGEIGALEEAEFWTLDDGGHVRI
jgi:hypothetical protein